MPPSRMAPKDFSPRLAVSSNAPTPLGQLRADRFGDAWSALDRDIRAVAAHQLGICWVGVGDDLYSLPFRGRDRVLSQKPSTHRPRLRSDPSSAQQFPS